MKKSMLLLILGAMPLSMLAQDDMYFVPSKKSAKTSQVAESQIENYYSGSSRSVDEYNRRGSYYEVLPDSDIINFNGEVGVYPDSISDFSLTENMTRWDDYVPSTSYWEGYSDGRRDAWGWHSPWYYSSYYPWYDSWYDPWYYGYGWYSPWHYGWYDPWYYGWGYGWRGYYSSWYYRPWHYYGGWYGGGYAHYSRSNPAGTRHHGYVSRSGNSGISNGRTHTYSRGTFGSSRSVGTFGGSRNSRTSGASSSRGVRSYGNSGSTYSNSNGNFGGSRSSSSSSHSSNRSYSPSSSSSSSGSFGGGSFGGSRSSGGSFGGGSRSGGGGHSGGFGSGRR